MRMTYLYAAGLLALVSIVGDEASAQTEVTVSVSNAPTAMVGNEVFVDVNIANVTDLHAWRLDLAFTPSVLSGAFEPAPGSFLSSGGPAGFLPGTIDNFRGIVSGNVETLFTAGAGVSGSGDLLRFYFSAIGAGSSALILENVHLLNSSLEPIPDRLAYSTITVSNPISTPEPTTLGLLALGLGALSTRYWRRFERETKFPD